MSISRECTGVNGEALHVHVVDKILFLNFTTSPYQVLQVIHATPGHAEMGE